MKRDRDKIRQLCTKMSITFNIFELTFNNFANVFQEINIWYFVFYTFKRIFLS